MKILFLGDFLYDYDQINDDILAISEYIKKNNLITILNFEGSFKSECKYKKSINLHCSELSIEVLKLLNVKAVNLANNHIMDYSKEGLEQLIRTLDKENIGHFGAGLNEETSLKPYILPLADKKIAFYGFGWKMEECIEAKKNKAGTAPLDFSLINQLISNCDADYVIPSLHFGYEFENLPQPYHLKECRKLIKNNRVKAIIGHHPHVVGACEKNNNIFYSLGNFYFGTMRKRYTEDFKYYPAVNRGIGIILDTKTWKSEVIKIVSYNEKTVIDNDEPIPNLVDVGKIKTSDYTEYFYKNNNILNKKYVYKIGDFYEKIVNKTHYFRRQCYKFYLRKIKWPLAKTVKKVLQVVRGKKNEK